MFLDDGTIVISLPPDFDDDLDLADGIEMSVAAMSTNSESTSVFVSWAVNGKFVQRAQYTWIELIGFNVDARGGSSKEFPR
jgi:hypothetical protein